MYDVYASTERTSTVDVTTGKARTHRRRWRTATAVVATAGLFATLSACTAETEQTPVEVAQPR